MIRWHSITCKTCAHYLWNLPSGDLAGYGCAVLEHLTTANFGDAICPSYLEHQYAARWYNRISSRNRLERLPDYASDGRWREAHSAHEAAEWTAAICTGCGEYRHECRCEPEDEPEA